MFCFINICIIVDCMLFCDRYEDFSDSLEWGVEVVLLLK